MKSKCIGLLCCTHMDRNCSFYLNFTLWGHKLLFNKFYFNLWRTFELFFLTLVVFVCLFVCVLAGGRGRYIRSRYKLKPHRINERQQYWNYNNVHGCWKAEIKGKDTQQLYTIQCHQQSLCQDHSCHARATRASTAVMIVMTQQNKTLPILEPNVPLWKAT